MATALNIIGGSSLFIVLLYVGGFAGLIKALGTVRTLSATVGALAIFSVIYFILGA